MVDQIKSERRSFCFFLIVCLLIVFSVIVIYGCVEKATETVAFNTSYDTIAVLFVIALLAIVIIVSIRNVFRFINRAKNQALITSSLFLLTVLVLAFFLLSFRVAPNGDSLDDIDTAFYLLTHETVGADIVHAPFIRAYGNNYFFITLLYGFILIFRKIGISDYLFCLYCINAIAIVTSQYLLWSLIKKERDIQSANKFLFLSVINPVYYGLVFWVYTLIISLPFMVGGVALLYHVASCKQKTSRLIISSIFAGIITFLGFQIRPTAIFPIIAFYVFCLMTKTCIKRFLVVFIIICIVFAFLYLLWSQFSYSIFELFYEKNLPISYWLAVGAHGNGTLSTQNQKNMSLLLNMNPSEKFQAGLDIAVNYYKENGLIGTIKLWIEKIKTTWGDGYSGINERLCMGKTDSIAFQYIAGERNQLAFLYSQAYRIVIFIGIIIYCMKWLLNLGSARRNTISMISCIVLFGGLFFYMLWEAKNVYSSPFILFEVVISASVYSGLFKKYDIRIKKRSHVCFIIISSVLLSAGLYLMLTGTGKYTNRYIQALKANRVIVPIEFENLEQDYYIYEEFNQIEIKATVKEGWQGETIPQYCARITDENDKETVCLFDSTSICDGKLSISFSEKMKAGHYCLNVSTNQESGNIVFYSSNTYDVDYYLVREFNALRQPKSSRYETC